MTPIARLLLPTCFLMVLVAFVQTFQAKPSPPTTRETVAVLGSALTAKGVGLEVITASCLPTIADGNAEPSKCIASAPTRPLRYIRNADGSICAWRGSYDDKIVICDPALSFSMTQSERGQ